MRDGRRRPFGLAPVLGSRPSPLMEEYISGLPLGLDVAMEGVKSEGFDEVRPNFSRVEIDGRILFSILSCVFSIECPFTGTNALGASVSRVEVPVPVLE